jgi:hypothetical protein
MDCRNAESPAVRQRLRAQGGMIVLIDGVQFDDHSAVLYVVTDVMSHTTLFAERHEIRSEKGLRPLLERLKAMDVPILALVTDKETGLVPAIHAVFPDARSPWRNRLRGWAPRSGVPPRSFGRCGVS